MSIWSLKSITVLVFQALVHLNITNLVRLWARKIVTFISTALNTRDEDVSADAQTQRETSRLQHIQDIWSLNYGYRKTLWQQNLRSWLQRNLMTASICLRLERFGACYRLGLVESCHLNWGIPILETYSKTILIRLGFRQVTQANLSLAHLYFTLLF